MSEAQQLLLHQAALFSLDQITLRIASDLIKSAVSSEILKKKSDLLVRCAILVASREVESKQSSQEIEDQKQVDLAKITVTQILSEDPGFRQEIFNVSICEFSAGLQQFLVVLEFQRKTIQKMMSIIQNCEFIQTLFDKYQVLLNKTKLRDYKAIGWLLFSLARTKILQSNNDPRESIELMLSVAALVLRSSEKQETPIQEHIQALKDILDLPKEGKQQSYEDGLILILRELDVLEVGQDLLLDLSGSNQAKLLKILDLKLNTITDADVLDHRYFLRATSPSDAVRKNSPFANRVVVTPAAPVKPQFHFGPIAPKACTQLTFNENWQTKKFETQSPARNFGLKLFPKDSIQSPFSQKPRKYCSTPLPTPMTGAILMNNWLLQSVRNYPFENPLSPSLKQFYGDRAEQGLKKVDMIVNTLGPIISARKTGYNEGGGNEGVTRGTSIIRTQQLRGILLFFIESMVDQQGEQYFYSSLGVCAAETILFIRNIQSTEFLTILKESKLHPYSFFSLLDKFLNKIQSFPSLLKHHFSVVRQRILLEWAWMGDSPLQYELAGHENLEYFMKQVLESASGRLYALASVLSLGQGQSEKAWLVVKYVLREQTQALFSRHIDQIVLCGVYIVVGPVAERQALSYMPFNEILKRYKEIKDQSILQAKLNISQVMIENGRFSDIVDFYNEIFLPLVKDFIYNSQTISMIAQSPCLKECTRNLENRRKVLSIQNNLGLTPRTLALRAPIEEKLPKTVERQRQILDQLKEEEEEEEEESVHISPPTQDIVRDSSRMFGKSLFSTRKPTS